MTQPQLLTPILIQVLNGGWTAFPLYGNELTARDRDLISAIRTMGGIDESVPQGYYHFNIVPGPRGDILTLIPVRK